VKAVRCGVGAGLLLWLVAACGSHPATDASPPTSSVGGTSSAPECPSIPCTCDDGLRGFISCETQTCDCSACPEFTRGRDLDFASCAGDPTGVWRLSGREESRFEFLFRFPSGGLSPACIGQNTRTDQTHDWLLELLAGGQGALHYVASETEVDFTRDCLERDRDTCTSVTDLQCEDLECGLCRCKILPQYEVLDLGWSVDKAVLTLTWSQGAAHEFSFCTGTDQLHLQTTTKSLQLDLDRVYLAGRPTPCVEREVPDCGQGACRAGQCVGAGSCSSAADSVACAMYPDCEWDATHCRGDAPPHCSFRDYVDHTMGCELSSDAPHCAGVPLPCADQPSCLAKGCLVGSACAGGEHMCFLDQGIEGCTCTSSTKCTGTFNCANLEQSLCESLTGDCYWSTTACIATAMPCEQLTAGQCELTAGCFLQAP
jgi:hypothetical protein